MLPCIWLSFSHGMDEQIFVETAFTLVTILLGMNLTQYIVCNVVVK